MKRKRYEVRIAQPVSAATVPPAHLPAWGNDGKWVETRTL